MKTEDKNYILIISTSEIISNMLKSVNICMAVS